MRFRTTVRQKKFETMPPQAGPLASASHIVVIVLARRAADGAAREVRRVGARALSARPCRLGVEVRDELRRVGAGEPIRHEFVERRKSQRSGVSDAGLHELPCVACEPERNEKGEDGRSGAFADRRL